ncbi:MAG: DUF2207 domain-containing protein [bacterium]
MVRFWKIVGGAMTVFSLLVLPRATQALSGGFDFNAVQVTAEIQKSGQVKIEEIIEVKFFEERHGIVRKIPIKYTDTLGNTRSIRLEVQGVKESGAPIAYTETREGDNVVLQIGDATKLVMGPKIYLISYTVDRVINRFDDYDEFYWNATGVDSLAIPKRVATYVILPSDVPESSVKTTCYTGGLGSKFQNCEQSVSMQAGKLTADFKANDFLTVVVGFEKGHVFVPGALQKFGLFLVDNPIVFLPLIVFGLMYLLWLRKGKDPRLMAIVVEYEPPENLRPGEVGTLVDGKVHDVDLSAIIVDLAVRGYLKIIEEEKKSLIGTSRQFKLELTDKSQDDLLHHEQLLVKAFFGASKTCDLSQMKNRAATFVKERKAVETDLYTDLVNRKWYTASPEAVRGSYLVAAFVIAGVAWFIGSALSVAAIVSLILCALLVAGFGWYMPRRTEAGTRVFEKALGFREYLSRAEQYRLKWQESENVFEKFLPYAMVFGVVDKWAKALEPMIRQPAWYSGPDHQVWNFIYFNHFMNSFSSSLNAAAGVKPGSGAASGNSGFGGGGFSGGGFGGGSTGSW